MIARALLTFFAAFAFAGPTLAEPLVSPSDRVRRNVVVRPSPGADSSAGKLLPGETADLLSEVPGWYQVRLRDGTVGFVSKTWTVVIDEDDPSELVSPTSVSDASDASHRTLSTYIRVVDVGNGLCVIVRAPGEKTMLYDAGYSGDFCPKAVTEIVGARPIDYVVLSHSDEDHISDGDAILGAQGVRTILHPGDNRTGRYLDPLRRRITQLEQNGTAVFSMARNPPPFGTTYALGAATLRLVAGWGDGLATVAAGDPALPPGDRHNALSLVFRLEYGGRSVLLTGDTIGRRGNEPGQACRNAERIMVEGVVPIDSDILIGQHHGGDNSTSNCFIRAVSPKWVVFSAGRGHGHPRQSVVDRLIANHVPVGNILRTDRADNEGEGQWVYQTFEGCKDKAGDDDVEIWLYADGREPKVQYRTPEVACPS